MIDTDAVRNGIVQHEFFLEYMPTISLADGECVGAEALVRWRRPDGVVPPDQFIPLIENTPLAGSLTYYILDTIADELGDWLRADQNLHIGVNVPPAILGRGGMEYVARKSGLIELAPQMIMEITERGIPDSMAVDAINQATTQLGIKVALDDVTFVGGANLAVLLRCNLFYIKLDKSLIDQITEQCPHPEWLKSVTALLESSHLQVFAEGVETEQQAKILRAAQIQAAQGFYFSRPLSAAALFSFQRSRSVSNQTVG